MHPALFCQVSADMLAKYDAVLRRVCKAKKGGRLDVPKEVHEKWKMGGTARRELMQVMIRCNGNRDSFA